MAPAEVTTFFLENLGQRSFRKGGGHAEEGGNPHPEQSPRTAGSNGAGNTDHIARSHTHGRTEEESSQRRYARLNAPSGSQRMNAHGKQPHLDKAQADGKVNAGTHQYDNCQ